MLTDNVAVITSVIDARNEGEDVPDVVQHPYTNEDVATIDWHDSGGYRGWYEATPVQGWKKVGDGSNCGDWGDTPPGTSNAECEAQIEELAKQYEDIVVVLGGGSNVFCVQYDVLAREVVTA